MKEIAKKLFGAELVLENVTEANRSFVRTTLSIPRNTPLSNDAFYEMKPPHADARTLAFYSSLEEQVVHLQQVKNAETQAQAAKNGNASSQTVGFFGPRLAPTAAAAGAAATGN